MEILKKEITEYPIRKKIGKLIDEEIERDNRRYVRIIEKIEPLIESYAKLAFKEKLAILTRKDRTKKIAAVWSLEENIKNYSDIQFFVKLCYYESDPLVKNAYVSLISKAICIGAGREGPIALNGNEIEELKNNLYFPLLLYENHYLKNSTVSILPVLPFDWIKEDKFYSILVDYLSSPSRSIRNNAAIAISRMYKDFEVLYRAFFENESESELIESIFYSIRDERDLSMFKDLVLFLKKKCESEGTEDSWEKLHQAELLLKEYEERGE
jgi:hypothetical protein